MTNVDYKIIKFDEAAGQITVRFRDVSPIAIDLPIDADGNTLIGEALSDYLKGFVPAWHYERLDRIAQGIKNAAEIHALVEPEVEESVVLPPEGPDDIDLLQEQIETLKVRLSALEAKA
jgi:hypothetical protein